LLIHGYHIRAFDAVPYVTQSLREAATNSVIPKRKSVVV